MKHLRAAAAALLAAGVLSAQDRGPAAPSFPLLGSFDSVPGWVFSKFPDSSYRLSIYDLSYWHEDAKGSSAGRGTGYLRRSRPGVSGVDVGTVDISATVPEISDVERVSIDAILKEGRALWRSGDSAAALAKFKEAVAANTGYGLSQVYMALGLWNAGEGKHADKALRSAFERMRDLKEAVSIPLAEVFRDSKERTRFVARLEKPGSGGGLTAALALIVLGHKDAAAKALSGMDDAAARRLAELAR